MFTISGNGYDSAPSKLLRKYAPINKESVSTTNNYEKRLRI